MRSPSRTWGRWTAILGVFLALNPGQTHLGLQGRSGLFADEIRHHGT
jgi:hypothetical protein